MFMMDDNGEMNPEGSVESFATLSSEGDLLLQRGCLHMAIAVYTKALLMRPRDKHCLVCRARCYIAIGSPELALKDAESSVQQDPNFFKGIHQKAEALYAQGDFESALVHFHRGHSMRPEMDEFRIGIQKAREAIENSIGNPKDFKIKVPQKLKRYFNDRQLARFAPTGSKKGSNGGASSTQLDPYHYAGTCNPSRENKILGELCEDKAYLEGLLNDKDFVHFPDDQIVQTVKDGLRYIHTRVEFWRQQNPLYARPKEKHIQPRLLAKAATISKRMAV